MFTTLILAALVVAPGEGPKPASNTVCPVRGDQVTPGKSPKVVVRGQEYYLCCLGMGCDTKLLKNPDQYLEKDGTPKNAKGKPAQAPGAHHH